MQTRALSLLPLVSLLLAGQACSQGHHQHRHGQGHKHGQEQLAKPFEDIDEYIRHLERSDRAKWQKPDQVIAWLSLAGTETLVDVGAGSGYFAFRFAKALPKGRVVATDIEQGMLDHVRAQAAKAMVGNLTTALVKPADPGIPADADLVFVCNVYHHIPDRAAWLASVKAQMGPQAKLVFVEFKADSPIGPPADIRLAPAALRAELEGAGFRQVKLDTALLPYQYLAVYER